MKSLSKLLWMGIRVTAVVAFLAAGAFTADKPAPHYVFTNDDLAGKRLNSSTIYTIGPAGTLTEKTAIHPGSGGIAAGLFGLDKVSALQNGKQECLYVTDSLEGQVAGVVVPTLTVAGVYPGSNADGGQYNGVGLAMNSKYLYASFTASNTIGTFKVIPGCKLKFVGDVDASGINGGTLDGMAVHGNLLVVTYGDGSIESFNVSKGKPIPNGDKQNSTGFRSNNYPSGVDIASDGHYAIFGDLSISTVVEVSDISSGKLTKTVVYDHLGSNLNSVSVRLSPDESLLYIGNTQGGEITAAFFDKTAGTLSKGCSSAVLQGFGSTWAYIGTIVTENNTGTGGAVYAAEYGAPSSIGIVEVKSSGGKCTLTESSKSPAMDATSSGLLSIGVYPPRPF